MTERKQRSIRFNLDIKPLSINQCFQGRRFLNQRGKDFIETCLYKMPKIKTMTGNIELFIRIFRKSNLFSFDISNTIKILEDCIVKKKLISDDRFIVDLHIQKRKADRDWVEIEIIDKNNQK